MRFLGTILVMLALLLLVTGCNKGDGTTRECSVDEDCIVPQTTAESCCECPCGCEEAVSREEALAREAWRDEQCSELQLMSCPQPRCMAKDYTTIAVCEQGKCIAKQEPI